MPLCDKNKLSFRKPNAPSVVHLQEHCKAWWVRTDNWYLFTGRSSPTDLWLMSVMLPSAICPLPLLPLPPVMSRNSSVYSFKGVREGKNKQKLWKELGKSNKYHAVNSLVTMKHKIDLTGRVQVTYLCYFTTRCQTTFTIILDHQLASPCHFMEAKKLTNSSLHHVGQSGCVSVWSAHLELRPVHGHVDAVRVGPQPQVFVVVRVVHRVVKLLVDLRQAAKWREIMISDSSINPWFISVQGDLSPRFLYSVDISFGSSPGLLRQGSS